MTCSWIYFYLKQIDFHSLSKNSVGFNDPLSTNKKLLIVIFLILFPLFNNNINSDMFDKKEKVRWQILEILFKESNKNKKPTIYNI